MPRYTIIDRPTFINGDTAYPGAIVEFEGWPGSTLEPADDVAARVKAYYSVHRRDRGLPRNPDLTQFQAPAAEPEVAEVAAPKPRGRPFKKAAEVTPQEQADA